MSDKKLITQSNKNVYPYLLICLFDGAIQSHKVIKQQFYEEDSKQKEKCQFNGILPV